MATAVHATFGAPSQAPLIRRLQWVSMDSSILFLAVSTIASRDRYLSRIIPLATIAFELALLWMDRRNRSRATSIERDTIPTPREEGDGRQIHQNPRSPMACRKWAIGIRTVIVVGWAMVLALAIVHQVAVRRASAYAIFMTIWVVAQLGIVGNLEVICFRERQEANGN